MGQRGFPKKVRYVVTRDRAPTKPSGTGAEPDVFARTKPASTVVSTTANDKPMFAADPQANVFAQPSPPAAPAPRRAAASFDPADIMTSIGEVPYEWTIVTDAIAWGVNAAEILMVRDPEAIATGRAFAKLTGSDKTLNRFDAVMKSARRDDGQGVPYQIQYSISPDGSDRKLWIEDVGRWFADSRGGPARAHGVIRVINERHEQEEKLTYLSRFDALTGEMNRWHLTEVLSLIHI